MLSQGEKNRSFKQQRCWQASQTCVTFHIAPSNL